MRILVAFVCTVSVVETYLGRRTLVSALRSSSERRPDCVDDAGGLIVVRKRCCELGIAAAGFGWLGAAADLVYRRLRCVHESTAFVEIPICGCGSFLASHCFDSFREGASDRCWHLSKEELFSDVVDSRIF